MIGLQALPTMTAPLAFTLDVAQLVMLGGLIWGLAKMSASVDDLKVVTKDLTAKLGPLITRVTVLEDRDAQRRDRRWDDTQ